MEAEAGRRNLDVLKVARFGVLKLSIICGPTRPEGRYSVEPQCAAGAIVARIDRIWFLRTTALAFFASSLEFVTFAMYRLPRTQRTDSSTADYRCNQRGGMASSVASDRCIRTLSSSGRT